MLASIIKIFGTSLFILGLSLFYGGKSFSKKTYKIFGILCIFYVLLNILNMILTKNFYTELVLLNSFFFLLMLVLNYFSDELCDFENGSFRTIFYSFFVVIFFAIILYWNFK